MKLIDIAQKIDKSEFNESSIDVSDFNNEFNLDLWYTNQDRLKAYFIGNWLCTDSWVGYRMYFLDDEPVCISTQEGRKCDEHYEWFSEELAMKVRKYLLSLKEEDDLNFQLIDISKDIGNGFGIQFSEQIIHPEKATFNGQPVKILEHIKNKPYGIDTLLKIEMPDGVVKEVEVTDLEFMFNLVN